MRKELPIRKKLRYQYYDYSSEGSYFITICIKNRRKILGNIKENKYIRLSKYGEIAQNKLNKIEQIYTNIIIEDYVIMPNHIHLILAIKNKNEKTVSRIIKQYKTEVTKELGYSIWQKSFYEHIIRNEKEYLKIKEYIQDNIQNWEQDIYF